MTRGSGITNDHDPLRVAEQPPSLGDPQGIEIRTSICPQVFTAFAARPVAIYANHQTFWVEILCDLILLSYFEVVIGII